MEQRYDSRRVEGFYDQHGGNESIVAKRLDEIVSRRLHSALLHRFVGPGDRVFEIGAGLGIFTVELIKLGANVVVGDISAKQLERHKEHLAAAGLQSGVEARIPVDVVDLSVFPDSCFDHTVCYRGPLGYALDQAEIAMQELLRVTRPGGTLLASVFSFWGWLMVNQPSLSRRGTDVGIDRLNEIARYRVVSSGDGPAFRLFTLEELQTMASNCGGRILATSTDGLLCRPYQLAPGADDDKQLVRLLWKLENNASKQPGLLEAGVRILLAVTAP